jgi:serine/threonine protein kinase
MAMSAGARANSHTRAKSRNASARRVSDRTELRTSEEGTAVAPARCVALIEAIDSETIHAGDVPWFDNELVANQFRLRKLLGSGGMSCVWDAYDLLMHRPIALKTTRDPRRSAVVLTREARALAVSRHRGLPVAFSVGAHRGWTYLALERLVGVTLAARLAHARACGGLMAMEESIAILSEVAEVLTYVHGIGMAHHDVKPSNVMLCSDGRVMLLDLGIMIAEVNTAGSDDAGTPRYLAPEAFQGGVAPGHARFLDIYAFGVMAFEVIAGRSPFRADTFRALMHMHASVTPLDVRVLRPDAPAALAALVAACLAKTPFERPASMESISWDLRALRRRAHDEQRRR